MPVLYSYRPISPDLVGRNTFTWQQLKSDGRRACPPGHDPASATTPGCRRSAGALPELGIIKALIPRRLHIGRRILTSKRLVINGNEKERDSTGNLSDQGHPTRHEPVDLAPAAGARGGDSGALARRATGRHGMAGLPHARIPPGPPVLRAARS